MRLRSLPFAACLALGAMAWGIIPGSAPSSAVAAEKPTSKPAAAAGADTGKPVAVVAGKPITAAELDELAGSRLFQVRQQEYTVRKQVLDDAIGKRLFEAEAATRKISVDELSRLEIDGKAAPVTDAEKKDFYEKNRS